MKSLEEILKEKQIPIYKESDYEAIIQEGEIVFYDIAQLESLINEVISQRLGEPVAYTWKNKKISDYIWPNNDKSYADNPAYEPLYALNIES